MISRVICLCLLTLGILMVPGASSAQQSFRIAAIVNDDIISAHDLFNRVSVAIISSRLPNTEETRRRLTGSILRTMINERLQSQEAERLGIEVSDEDVAQAITQLERQNNLAPGQFLGDLTRSGVDENVMREKVISDLKWNRALRRIARQRIDISDAEIDQVIREQEAAQGKPEYLLSEIFLPLDNPSQAGQVEVLAERLVQQIRQGASFEGLARQFSESGSAGRSGDMGWMRTGILNPELEKAVRDQSKGSLIGPIRTTAGLYILRLRDSRVAGQEVTAITLTLAQATYPAGTDIASIQQVSSSVANCQEFPAAARNIGATTAGELGTFERDQLASDLRNIVDSLQVNQTSAPLERPNGLLVLMLCNRQGGEVVVSKAGERSEIRNTLFIERATLLAQRTIRDLRREAFVDIRL